MRPQDEIESFTRVGQQMPAFTVSTLEGTKVSIGDLKGKVVLVNFWATWCPPCLVEMPRLEKEVWQKYKSSDFQMVAIAREQTEEEVAAFRREHRFSFPLATDPEREVFSLFGTGGIPRSYVIAADGKIVFQSVGYDPKEFDEMKKLIQKELAKVQKQKASK
jgi:peroxiredoxin